MNNKYTIQSIAAASLPVIGLGLTIGAMVACTALYITSWAMPAADIAGLLSIPEAGGVIFGVTYALLLLSIGIGYFIHWINQESGDHRGERAATLFRPIVMPALMTLAWFAATQLGFTTSIEMLAAVGAIGGAVTAMLFLPSEILFERREKGHIAIGSVLLFAGIGSCSMLLADTILSSLASTANFALPLDPIVIAAAYMSFALPLCVIGELIWYPSFSPSNPRID